MKLSQKALGWLGGGVTGLLNGLFGSGGGMVAVPLLEHGGLEPARAHATSIAVILPLTALSAELSVFRVGGFFGGSALPPRRSAGVLGGQPSAGQALLHRPEPDLRGADPVCGRKDVAVIDWVAILAGFGSAVLASMGMGGGSILILYLTLIAGVPQREAQGVNLLFFLPIGAAALWLHWRQGRVDKTAVRQFLPTGLLGALLGTGLAMLADESLLRRGFAVFLLLIGLRQLFPGKPKKKKTGPEE